ncbi:MAG: hypothetical protein ACP5XB_12010, partial [Isosphaeraceae bacterium]
VTAPAALTLSSTLSGSASTLARGVLTTMAVTQIKLIGAGVAAAGVLLGGVGAGAWVLGAGGQGNQKSQRNATQAPAPVQASKRVVLPSSSSEVPPTAPQPSPLAQPQPSVESRLPALERKLDMLLKLMQQNREPISERGGIRQPRWKMRSTDPPVLPSDAPLPSPVQQAQNQAKLPLPPREEPSLDRLPVGNQNPAQPPLPRAEGPAQERPPLANQSPFEADRVPQPPREKPSPFDLQPGTDLQPNLLPQPPQPVREPSPFDLRPAANPQSDQPPQNPPAEPQFPANPPRFSRLARDPFETPVAPRSSLKEIEAQIRIALAQFERNKAVFQSGVIGKEKYDEPVEQLRLLLGRLDGWDDELAEGSERLEIEKMKKNAEVKMAEAQLAGTSATVARIKRLNERNKGTVASEEWVRADSDHAAASANVEVRQAEAKEVELRQAQLGRRREGIKACIALIRKSVPELGKEQGPAKPF